MSRLAPGQMRDRYRIEAPLGRGGMGEVYRAYDERLRRYVALKVISFGPGGSADETLSRAQCARLVREAQAAAGLKHACIVTIFDVGDEAGEPYIAMELVEGKPLRAYLHVPVELERRVRWLADIASGLAAAHHAGLVHRDVKPDNVMVCSDDSVKILDFGIAKFTVEEGAPFSGAAAVDSSRTATGSIVGTPRYMAPEQASGLTVDARSDQFAWGVTAYELLSGKHPRDASPGFSVAMAWSEAARPIRELCPGLTPEAAAVVMRAIERRPQDRFPSMDEIATGLGVKIALAIGGATPIAPPSLTAQETEATVTSPPTMGSPPPESTTRSEEVVPSPRRANRWPLALGASMLLAATALVGSRAWTTTAPSHIAPPVLAQVEAGPVLPASVRAPSLSVPDAAPPVPPSSSRPPATASASSASAPAASADDASKIALIQDRIRARLPANKAAFKQLCGYDIDIDIDWASFGHDSDALVSLSGNRGIERLVDAFKGVCNDAIGKDAAKAKVRRIRAINVPDRAKVRASVGGGAFTAELDWSSGAPALSSEDLAIILTKAL